MYNKLERKFGRYAIKGLMKYVVILYIAGFIIYQISPTFYYQYLMLDIDKVLHGQVWRIFSFIIQPMEDNIIFTALMCYVYYSIGTSLERIWGSFRFNLFYFSGILFNILAVVIIYVISYFIFGMGISYPVSLSYLNLSMFLAFAAMFPEMQFYLMFLIPIKAKYLCIGYVGLLAYEIFSAFRGSAIIGLCTTIVIMASMANFLISFFSTRKYLNPSAIKRRVKFRMDYNSGNPSESSIRNKVNIPGVKPITRHKCAVCGRTELDDPNLEFRFCSKCNGNYEYCNEHLFTHQHVQ